MTDIVERLRLYARHFEDLHAPQNVTIGMREAADEIERLRAALEKVATWRGSDLATDGRVIQMENIARAALEVK